VTGAWPRLPAAIRVAVVTLVQAVTRGST
jgi:hypothetical protein